MNLKGKSVLVTGGAGFVGSHLVERIIKDDPGNLVVVDNFYLGKKENLKSDVNVYNTDASSENMMDYIIRKENIEVVFDLAVIPLPVSLIDPMFCFNKNIDITMNMCELLRKKLYKTLIHFSSSEVYGTAVYAPMDESHPLNAMTPYASSKAASDLLVLSYYRTFGIDVSIIRPFNIYGPRQNDGSYAGVIPLTMKNIISGKSPIIEGDGKQTRDFTYVTDVVDAAIKIYESSATRGMVLNIASGKELSIKEIIDTLNKENLPLVKRNRRVGDVDKHLADITLAKTLIGYSPKVDYKDGLKRTRLWYERKN